MANGFLQLFGRKSYPKKKPFFEDLKEGLKMIRIS
jgi:hypothetical protein